jgi:hypothetical protein
MEMLREPEYLVMAVSPEDPTMPTPKYKRAVRAELETREEVFERAKKYQSWMKFGEGYRGVFIYECYRMDYVDGEFVSTVPHQDDPYSVTENDIIRAHVVEALLQRGYSEEEIDRLEKLGYLDVE